jgi:hypothetical protein
MTEISFNPKSGNLEVSVRMFTDDLEKALRLDCNCKVDLSKPEIQEKMKPLLKNYLQKKLHLFPDGKPVDFQFLGFEKEEESTWSFLEIKLPKAPVSLKVENSLLYEIQNQQSNLVRFRKAGFDKTIQLNYPETIVRF